jgi:hypothetical protein
VFTPSEFAGHFRAGGPPTLDCSLSLQSQVDNMFSRLVWLSNIRIAAWIQISCFESFPERITSDLLHDIF